MDTKQLPDQPRPGSDKTLATIANVEALMTEAGIRARYNEVKKKVEIDVPDLRGTSDNRDNVTLTAIVSLCAQYGMPTGLVGEYVNAIADRQAYNPVADWIGSKQWDGVDRLPELYATVIEQEGYLLTLKETLLHKWMRSAAAAATVPGYKGRGVLTFQGPQGIGKTSWVKALVSDRALGDSVVKLDHHLDAANKDTIISAVSNWVVEIGELDSSLKKDVARLKGSLAAQWSVPGADKSPMRSVPKLRFANARERFIDSDEAARLLEAAGKSRNRDLAAIVGLLLLLGMRVSELLSMRVANVDLPGRSLLITQSKNGTARRLPLPQAAVDIIEGLARPAGSVFLFPNPRDPTKHLTTIKHGWHVARDAARLEGLRIHDLRHSAASAWLNQGVPLATIGSLLGHKSVVSTARYSHFADDTLMSAMELGAAKLKIGAPA